MLMSKYTATGRHLARGTTRLSLALFFSMSILSATFCVAAPVSPNAITGYWVMPNGSALIEVFADGESYSVRVVALRETRFTPADELAGGAAIGDTRIDIHNPKPALRHRPVEGLVIASGLVFNNEKWTGGRIYDPGSGRTYRCTLELAEGGFLRVRGYMGISLLGDTLYWQRANDFKRRVEAMLAAAHTVSA